MKRISFLKKIALFVGVLIALSLLNIGYYFIFPDVAKLKKINPRKTSFMEYREKEWQRAGKKQKIRYVWVPFSQISSYAAKAVIIAEDDKFWSHEGFDFDAMHKAMEKNIKKGRFAYGGSTISQQLAKNLYLTPSRNPMRKIKEAVLTWRIEHNLSKRRILELYMNVAEWGEGIFGIEAASHHYYGKPASALTAQEAAKLVTVLPNPRRYKPIGNSRYVENRSERIYNIMVRRGIVIEEYEEIMKEPQEKSETESASNAKEPEDPKKSPDTSPGAAPESDSGKNPPSGAAEHEK
ncbi:MAG: monofunctional biosynthetic peptidoglycan transglycosylase [Syntrophales bacterium]